MQAGIRLGPYEIVSRIGAGGMGEVWRARDTRLGREVAIKILPAEFAADAKLKIRFEHEARTISQLNHPHICSLFDVGENYLVMELLEGESLAQRLARGPLPVPEVLKIGEQIAEALGKAHSQGVVHRDLKPGNIMLTKGGAKLLDFGLAKRKHPAVAAQASSAATEQRPLTQDGTIVGTLQYMAPEQLAGEEPDARADIFALGTVLYEMATGRRAFEADSRRSLIAAIVSNEPKPMAELQPLVPAALEHVVRKCLAKEPEDRWQNASDIAYELRWIRESPSGATANAPVMIRRKTRERVAWMAAVLAVAAIAAFVTRSVTRIPAPRRIMRVALALPAGTLVDLGSNLSIALSPDGNSVVYVAVEHGTSRLWIRHVDRDDAQPLTGTEGANSPFFSPDGQWIAFATYDGTLKKIAANGGAPISLCGLGSSALRGADWSEDGFIYFVSRNSDGVWKVRSDGGQPVAVSHPDRNRDEISHRWPQVLPDGKHLLITTKSSHVASFDAARIAVLSLDDGQVRTVVEGGTNARYLPTGHLIFGRGRSLYAVGFDLKDLRVRGFPVPVLDGVLIEQSTGSGYYTFSRDGSLLYLPDTAAPATPLTLMTPSGQISKMTNGKERLFVPRFSPDGTMLAVTKSGANDDICIFDPQRGTLTRFSFEPGNKHSPVWTPDGSHVIYSAELEKGPGNRILSKAADGGQPSEELLRSSDLVWPASVSPGGVVAYVEKNKATRADIWFVSIADRKRTPFLATPFNETDPQFSPDGRWLAYQSDESGRDEIYVRSFGRGARRIQVSNEGGVAPRWSHGGKSLIYWYANYFYETSVASSPELSIGTPQRLTALSEHPKDLSGVPQYDVAPDGRFAITADSPPVPLAHLNFVVNWFDDVRRRTESP